MTKMLKAVAIAALTVFGSANAAVISNVDLFSQNQAQTADGVIDGNSISSQVQATGPNVGTILGGYRELIVEKKADNLSDTSTFPFNDIDALIKMKVIGGNLNYSTDSGVRGTGIVRWDGATQSLTGGPTQAIDVTGLGGVNLGNVLTDQFALTTIFSDAGFTFRIEAYTSATQWTAVDIVSNQHLVPATTFVPLNAFLSCGFSDAVVTVMCGSGGAVDFSNVGALQAIIDPLGTQVSLDLTLDQVTVVPEPSGIALVGLALLGLGVTARRRKA